MFEREKFDVWSSKSTFGAKQYSVKHVFFQRTNMLLWTDDAASGAQP